MVPRVIASVMAAVAAVSAISQTPSAEWRTVTTSHFRVHYTVAAEAWALRAASRLESVRERVVVEVGYDPTDVTDVLVTDPVAQANGMALPLLGWPRMVLWTSPPGPASVVGFYSDWQELLMLHEDTHLVQMLRPSRNPTQRFMEGILPLGPIALRAPRWVVEGYATLVEGRLTASGRPNSDLRAAVLRQRARAGTLPDYRQLASDSQSWLGMSMAYLAGSAYLEWLVERGGPDSLKRLWARMTARSSRTFDEAFEGVFGEPPAKLYGRFTAELTWRALEAERRLALGEREGELWQDLSWSTGEPVVSSDGKRLAIVLRGRDEPSRLVVWSTAPDEEAEKKWREHIEKTLARDREDVAPVRKAPLPREPLHELVTRNDAEPFTPRFLPGGEAILFVRYMPDGDGFLHPDLFRWALATGKVERLTHLADVREADASPDGTWAAAVRNRHGFSHLVRVNLESGDVLEITPPSIEVEYAQPRVSPDGARIAFARHERGAWKVVVRDLASGREVELPTGGGATVAYPAWGAGGRTVFASVGGGGFIDVVAFASDGGGVGERVTNTVGAALAPAPTPDGSALFFLGLQANGLDLRTIALPQLPAGSHGAALAAGLAPAVRPAPPPAPVPLATAPVAPGRRYGLGRQEFAPLVGGNLAPSARALELGVRVGDVVGRLDALVVGSIADAAGPRGGALTGAWRGWPITVSARIFDATEDPSEQPRTVPELGQRLDAERQGLQVEGTWQHRWLAGSLELGGGVYAGRVKPSDGGSEGQRLGFVRARLAGRPSRGLWRLPWWASARFDTGRTGEDGWQRLRGEVEVGALYRSTGLLLAWQRASVHGAVSDLDRLQLGGVPGSVVPDAVLAGRILVPPLPAGTLLGEEYEGQRAKLILGGLPLVFERHRMWAQGEAKGQWLRLVGLEWDLTGDPLPLVRLPGFHVIAGVAYILDQPFEDVTQAWLGLTWRP
jgi:Tol biopolymer transport system component